MKNKVVETIYKFLQILGYNRISFRQIEINILSNNTDIINKEGNNLNTIINKVLLISNIIIYLLVALIFGYLIYLYYNKHISSIIFITFITILLLYKDL